jgi:hypothetical protein
VRIAVVTCGSLARVRRHASLRVGVQRFVVKYRHGVGLVGGPLCYGALTIVSRHRSELVFPKDVRFSTPWGW